MRRTLAGLLCIVIGLCIGPPGCTGADTPRAETVEPGRYIADFDRAWELVRDTHYDEDYNGVDWDAVRAELRPKAQKATTRGEVRAIINDMVGRLNQSHFGLIPEEVESPATEASIGTYAPSEADTAGSDPDTTHSGDGRGNAEVGLDFRVVDARALVTRLRPGGPAEHAGVRTGWELTKARDADIREIIDGMGEAVGERQSGIYARQAIGGLLQGAAGSTIPLTFLDAKGNERVIEVSRQDPPGSFVKFGNLPPMSTHLEHRWLTDEETGDPDARVGYIAFNIFMIPIAPQFERAMVDLQDADGIVIDLRGNPGGIGAMSSSLSRFFVTEPASLGTMTMRGAELQFNVEPIVVTSQGERLAPFTGPLAFVIDGTSASTSELFAGGLRALGRARTFGSPTAGMALPAAMDRLPSGDVLLHAIADYVNSDGTRLEGDGVPADVLVPVRRRDLLEGLDAPLREAARWIVQETAAAQSAAPDHETTEKSP